MRTFNHSLFLQWLSERKEEGKDGLSLLETLTGIGYFTLRRIRQGVRKPKLSEQLALAHATGIALDRLFPVFDDQKESV